MSDFHESHVIGGHKANLHNPNTSDESKEISHAILEQHGIEINADSHDAETSPEANPARVIAGHRGNLTNPDTSEESKAHSRKVLINMGATIDETASSDDEGEMATFMYGSDHVKNPGRVEGGLKAAISNPNVSTEAKTHAQERLDRLEARIVAREA